MHRSKKNVVFAGITVAFSLFGDMAMYTVLPVYYGQLGLSPIQVGLLLSVNRWIRLFTNTAAERLLSRYNKGLLFSAALATGALLALTYGAAPPFFLFLAARTIWGFCWSILRHAGTMQAIASADNESVGKYLGFFNSLVRIGFLLGTSLSGLLFDVAGFQGMFLLMAAFTSAGMPFALMSFNLKGRADHDDSHKEERPRGPRLELQGFIVGVVGSGMVMSTLGSVLATTADDNGIRIGTMLIGIATVNGILLATRHALGIAGSPLIGALIDKFGIERSLLFCMFGAGISLAGGVIVSSPFALVLFVIGFFLCETTLNIALSAKAGKGGPRRYARFVSASDLGSASGPLIGWGIIQLSIGSKVIFLTGTVLYLLGAIGYIVSRRRAGS